MSDYKTIDVALIVTQIFERLGIPYLIGGSVAEALLLISPNSAIKSYHEFWESKGGGGREQG